MDKKAGQAETSKRMQKSAADGSEATFGKSRRRDSVRPSAHSRRRQQRPSNHTITHGYIPTARRRWILSRKEGGKGQPRWRRPKTFLSPEILPPIERILRRRRPGHHLVRSRRQTVPPAAFPSGLTCTFERLNMSTLLAPHFLTVCVLQYTVAAGGEIWQILSTAERRKRHSLSAHIIITIIPARPRLPLLFFSPSLLLSSLYDSCVPCRGIAAYTTVTTLQIERACSRKVVRSLAFRS